MGVSSDGMLCSAKSLGLNDEDEHLKTMLLTICQLNWKTKYIGKNIEVVYKGIIMLGESWNFRWIKNQGEY